MATPAKNTPLRLVTPAAGAGEGETGELVPVAFLGRTSTADMQDPRASLSRQLRAARAWLPAGWFLVAYYWDVESGGLDLEARGRGQAWRAFASADLPRDGGLAALLAEAATGTPRFAAVVCEDIERSGRDTFNALKLEKKLSRAGIALFATDEPAVIEGVNSTTVLVRRMKQSVAEWLRLQIKEKTWKGLAEHALDGWNIGPAPYGYTADRVPHPVPVKASQGRSKTRLALDPARAPVVAQIFTWRVLGKLGMPAIAAKLNKDPARYPAPTGKGWTAQTVYAVLRNPKYTGHMVYGRIRKIGGQRVTVPRSEWLWSPDPVHPAIVDRATWDAAQPAGRDHATTRDRPGLSRHPAAKRTYAYRGRVRCRDCRRRMAGAAYASTARTNVYYQCPHNPANPRHAAANPDHPRTVKAPETRLDAITGLFFRDRVFGPGRAQLLAAQLPATDAAAAADRDAQVTALTASSSRTKLPRKPRSSPARPPARPGTRRRGRDAERDRRAVRRAARRTRESSSPPGHPERGHPESGRYQPARRAAAGRGHPARHARRPEGPAAGRVRHPDPVEQARPPGHRPRRDHRRHPSRPAGYSQPRPGRLR